MATSPFIIFFVFMIFIRLADADCYFPFLEASENCQVDSDCGGSPCVMDISISSNVCCKSRPGTISPQCPIGTSYSGIPILCDVSDGDDDCPAGYTCSASDDSSPRGICCK